MKVNHNKTELHKIAAEKRNVFKRKSRSNAMSFAPWIKVGTSQKCSPESSFTNQPSFMNKVNITIDMSAYPINNTLNDYKSLENLRQDITEKYDVGK